jgi:hypothetical protein
LKSVWVLMVFDMPSNNCVNSILVALDLSYNELGGLLLAFMGAREREKERNVVFVVRERKRGERQTWEEREFFL